MRHLRLQDRQEILQLRSQKMLLKDIAARFNVSDAQISNVVNGKHIPKRIKENPHAPVPFQEEDFSNLPNEVLFKHVKAFDFIG